MKQTPLRRKTGLRRAGKRTKAWDAYRTMLTPIFLMKQIYSCEVRLEGCTSSLYTGFAHRHKRVWYYPKDREEFLGDFNQVVLACTNCHDQLEVNRELTEETFLRLRGEESLVE